MDHFVLQMFPLTSTPDEDPTYFVGFENFLGLRLTTEIEAALKLNGEQAEKLAELVRYQGKFNVVIWKD